MRVPVLVLLAAVGCLSVTPSHAQAVREQHHVDITDIPRAKMSEGIPNAFFPYAAPASVNLDELKLAALADTTAAWVARNAIVGAEILIVKNRRTIWHETIGWSHRSADKPLVRNSFYRLRSMTKPFTGTAALILVEEKRLGLEDRVSAYLPSWDNEASRDITIEQLLTHKSGFEQNGTPEPASKYTTLREVADASGVQGPQHQPDDTFRYSDVNSLTLGAVVSEITGLALETFISRRILHSLRLEETHIGYSPDAAWASRMNPTYEKNEEGAWTTYWTPEAKSVFPYFRASGGMLSTTTDYARWLDIWMHDTRLPGRHSTRDNVLLSKSLVDQALRSHGGDSVGQYGYHWEVHQENPLIFGHAGSDGTLGVAVPDEQLIILFFTQSRRSGVLMEWLERAFAATGVARIP